MRKAPESNTESSAFRYPAPAWVSSREGTEVIEVTEVTEVVEVTGAERSLAEFVLVGQN